jgi:hypothetical protein
MKVNGQLVTGVGVAFDGCHKLYVCETQDDVDDAESNGYDIHPIGRLPDLWRQSCSLRFISNWQLNEQYVHQCERARFS